MLRRKRALKEREPLIRSRRSGDPARARWFRVCRVSRRLLTLWKIRLVIKICRLWRSRFMIIRDRQQLLCLEECKLATLILFRRLKMCSEETCTSLTSQTSAIHRTSSMFTTTLIFRKMVRICTNSSSISRTMCQVESCRVVQKVLWGMVASIVVW